MFKEPLVITQITLCLEENCWMRLFQCFTLLIHSYTDTNEEATGDGNYFIQFHYQCKHLMYLRCQESSGYSQLH